MARNTAEFESERSLGTIIKELTADLSMLFRSEIALLKLELKETVTKLGGGIGMFAAAIFIGLFGLAFLFVTIVLGLVALACRRGSRRSSSRSSSSPPPRFWW